MIQAPLITTERDDEAPVLFEHELFDVAFISRRDPDKDVSEDALFVVPLGDDSVCVGVIDGMGGTAAGGKAARVTAEVVARELAARSPETTLRAALVEGFERAHATVVETCGGGGATAVAAIVTVDTVQTIHSGDAEALLFGQRGRLKHRTPAHSPVGYALQAGVLTEWEALIHPERHFVSSAVGVEGMVIQVGPKLALSPRDTLLLCSDGLTDNVLEDEAVECLRSGPLLASLQTIADLATGRMHKPFPIPIGDAIGKRDDMTILVVRRRSPA